MFLLWLLIGIGIGVGITKVHIRNKLRRIIESEEIGIKDNDGNFITGDALLKILG